MNRVVKIALILIGILGITCYGIRVWKINKNVDLPKIQIYEKGEKVPYEKDFIGNSAYSCEGYSIQVLDRQVFTGEEFKEKYDVEVPQERHYDFYYTVDVKIYNDNVTLDEEEGISLWNIYLKSKNDFIIPEATMTVQINSLPGISFSLRPESDMDVTIIYTMNDIYYEDINEVKNTKYRLMITEYPVMKLLEIE